MSDLAWRAQGIGYAVACGGKVLETYRRPGFADAGTYLRVVPQPDTYAQDTVLGLDPDSDVEE